MSPHMENARTGSTGASGDGVNISRASEVTRKTNDLQAAARRTVRLLLKRSGPGLSGRERHFVRSMKRNLRHYPPTAKQCAWLAELVERVGERS